MKVKLTKSQKDLLNIGSKVEGLDGHFYYYIPFWFRSTDNSNIFEQYHLEKLPDELKFLIQTKRDEHRI